ncbi:MAG TPA: hypothetical protein PKJ08_13195, partial [Candidatus Cloacimonadota bacterium]|nr:hypothetical protein [Candidatus Cloacimonadota bacterium]
EYLFSFFIVHYTFCKADYPYSSVKSVVRSSFSVFFRVSVLVKNDCIVYEKTISNQMNDMPIY